MQLQGYMPESPSGGIEVVNVKQQGYDVFCYAECRQERCRNREDHLDVSLHGAFL